MPLLRIAILRVPARVFSYCLRRYEENVRIKVTFRFSEPFGPPTAITFAVVSRARNIART
jgi:hypothetical protein